MMTPKLRTYFGLVLAAALVMLLFGIDWSQLLDLTLRDFAGLVVFVGLAAFSEFLAVETGQGRRVRSSLAFLPFLAMIVVFPVAAVVVGVVISILTSRSSNWKHHTFNLAQMILACALAAIVFRTFATLLEVNSASADQVLSLFFPFYAAALVFFAVNIFTVSLYIAIRDQQNVTAIILDATGKGGGNFLYDILASPVALLVAFLYYNYYIAGLLAFVFPLLLVRYTYLSALQLDRANHDLLRVLIKAIETRDPYTSGHSLRVSTLARLVAEDHNLRAAPVARIEKAALLHDIGKIDALYAEIISKKSALSAEEFSLIKTHATKGAQLLQSLTSLEKEVIEGVRHHHEYYDGTGYPDGLAGKSIPLAARIIMLCDSVDAMLSDRPYRNALPISHVLHELQRCAGSQFDPDLVETVLANNTLARAELILSRTEARVSKPALAV